MIKRGPKSGNPKTIPIRRKLRKEPTPAESRLWLYLSKGQINNLKFRRQHSIGNYVIDFYCPAKKLIIEIDGDTHAGELAQKRDKIRTNYLKSLGYTLVRYNNRDVMNNLDGVYSDLLEKVNSL